MIDHVKNATHTTSKPPKSEIAASADNNEANDSTSHVKNSYLTTLFHILAVSIGPIVFSVPSAFSMVGYLFATIGIAVVGLVYAYNLRMFLKCCDKIMERRKISQLTFAESVRFSLEDSASKMGILAPYTGLIINILMVLTWGGELSFNVVFMCRSLQFLITYYTKSTFSVHIVLVCCALPCILISSFPNLRLSFLSIIAGTIDLVFLGFILVELYFNLRPGEVVKQDPVSTLRKIPNFLAVIFFTLNFTGIVLHLKDDMKRSEKFNTRFGTLTVSIFIICLVNMVFGLLGYLRYGHNAQQMIILNLPPGDILIQVMIGLYCIAIYFTYPVYFSVVFKIVWNEWIMPCMQNTKKLWPYEVVARITINAIIFVFMFVCPQLSIFTNIGGLICAITNSVIVPSMVQILVLNDVGKCHRFVIVVRNVIIIIIGLVLFYFGLEGCISEIVDGASTI